MNKLKKIHLLGIGIIIILVVVFASMFVRVYNEKNYWQTQAAGHNYSNWSRIHFMTSEVEKRGFTKDGIDDMCLYINGIVYSAVNNLSPRFSTTSSSYLLQTDYYQLALDISSDSYLDEEELKSAIDLFEEATKDLNSLSAEILKMAETPAARIQLIDEDSKIYKQAKEMTKEYSAEYGERFANFFSKLN